MLKRALRHGQGDGASIDDIIRSLAGGESKMWVVRENFDILACMVWTVTEHKKGRKVLVEFLAGKDMDLWVGMLEELLQDYRDLVGAMCVEASCRKGLAKKLSERGWRSKAVIMEAPK